jgi:hypothetical protein
MCHIKVTAYNDWLASPFKIFQVGSEIEVPLIRAILLPLESGTRVRHIDANQEEFVIFQSNCATLFVVFVHPNVVFHVYRFDLREGYRPSIALDWRLAAIPVLEVGSREFIL